MKYTTNDLLHLALRNSRLDENRVISTYADPTNWIQVYDSGRCYWAWVGPMTVGYELARTVERDTEVDNVLE